MYSKNGNNKGEKLNKKIKIGGLMKEEKIEFINRLPVDYKNTLYKVINYAQMCFDSNLCNVTLGGSGGKNKIIDGWSDIDLYVILKDYNIDEISKFMECVKRLDIHVGTTYYTLDELDRDMIDSKTKIMLYEKQNFGVNPTLYGLEVFKNIPYDVIVENDWRNLPDKLHDFRRRFIDLIGQNDDKVPKVYVKKMFVLLKCVLNCYGVFSYGYDTSIEKMKLLALREEFDLTPIFDFDIMSLIKNMDNAKEDIIKFSTFLLHFIDYSYKKKGENKKWIKELVREQ